MDKLEEKLNHYLDAEQADLAIEIDGAWGMGKTYTLKKYFEKRKDERLVYISVNGVQASKVDDLFYEAAIAALPKNTKGIKTKTFNMARYFNKFNLSIKGLSIDVPLSFIANQAQEQLKDRSLVYLVDDLERIADEKALAKVFGFISSILQETYEARVIILVNEAKFNESKLSYFANNREKIINHIIRFDINKNLVLESLTEKLNNYPINQTENLSSLVDDTLIARNDNLNLRSIKVLIEYLNEIKEEVISLELEDMKSENIRKQFWIDLVNSLYKIVTTFRKGNVVPQEISKEVDIPLEGAKEQLIKYVISGDSFSIKNLITQYAKNHQLLEKNPTIEALMNFREKTENELQNAQKELANESELKFEDVREIINLLSVISFLHEQNLWLISDEEYAKLLNSMYTCLSNYQLDDFDDYLSIPEGFRPQMYGHRVKEKVEEVITKIKENDSKNLRVIEEIKNGNYRDAGWYVLKDQGKSESVFSRLMSVLTEKHKNSTEVRNILRYMVGNFDNFNQSQKTCFKTSLEEIKNSNSNDYDKILLFNISEQLASITESNQGVDINNI